MLKSALKEQGYTLVETLVVCSVMAIIFLGVIPNLNALFTRNEQTLAIDRLKNAIEFARQEAFRRNKMLSLCPSRDHHRCSYEDTWDVGFILFENPNRETQPAKDSILQTFPGVHYGKIIYKGPSNELNIQADGTTQNIARLVYCPYNKKAVKPKGLVINWVARLYPAEDNLSEPLEPLCGF